MPNSWYLYLLCKLLNISSTLYLSLPPIQSHKREKPLANVFTRAIAQPKSCVLCLTEDSPANHLHCWSTEDSEARLRVNSSPPCALMHSYPPIPSSSLQSLGTNPAPVSASHPTPPALLGPSPNFSLSPLLSSFIFFVKHSFPFWNHRDYVERDRLAIWSLRRTTRFQAMWGHQSPFPALAVPYKAC